MYCDAVSDVISEEERERLILEHLPQVRLIARRIQERLPESVSLDDLVSTGVIGLIAATSILFMLKLPPDAGAELSGHRAKDPKKAVAAEVAEDNNPLGS